MVSNNSTTRAPYSHYRLCNASVALVTSRERLSATARELADDASRAGMRLGVVMVPGGENGVPESFGELLLPLEAVAVLDDAAGSLASLVRGSIERASRDGSSPWCGRVPRIVTLPLDLVSSRSALEQAVQAMTQHQEPMADRLSMVFETAVA